MGDKSAIEWTDATWNPTYGCTKVSPECANCYIERTPPYRVAGLRFDRKGHIPIQLHEDRLLTPLRWTRPRRIFVNSLSDLFHEDVPDAFIDQVFAVMALAPQHTFQVLTKRPERMLRWSQVNSTGGHIFHVAQQIDPKRHGATSGVWPLPNVWLGVTAGNQRMADLRIPLLLQTPAAVRFLSAEPLLGGLKLGRYLRPVCQIVDYEDGCVGTTLGLGCLIPKHLQRCLDWVIAGGESGPRRRQLNPDHVRSLRDQCVAAGVAFLFKQCGGPTAKSGGRELDGRTWDEYPT